VAKELHRSKERSSKSGSRPGSLETEGDGDYPHYSEKGAHSMRHLFILNIYTLSLSRACHVHEAAARGWEALCSKWR
jgi:hypothetical protein